MPNNRHLHSAVDFTTDYTANELQRQGLNVETSQVRDALLKSGASPKEIANGTMPHGFHSNYVERKRSSKPAGEIEM